MGGLDTMAMDIERLKQALRNADAAGDAVAARKLANALKTALAEQQPADKGSFARQAAAGLSGFNRGLANIAGAPVSGMNWVLDQVGVPVSDEPFMGQNWVKSRLQDAGAVREPDRMYPTTERIGQMVGEGVGTISTGGAIGVVDKVGKLGQAARTLTAPATSSAPAFAAQVPVEAAASGASILGGNVGGNIGGEYFGERGRQIGQSVGTLAGAMSPGVLAAAPAATAHKLGRRPGGGNALSSTEIANALDNSGIEKSGGLVGTKAIARAENTASYTPVVGSGVAAKQQRQLDQFDQSLHDTTSRIRGGPAHQFADPTTIGGRAQDMAEEGLANIQGSIRGAEDALSRDIQGINSAVDVQNVIDDAVRLKAGTTPAQQRIIDDKIADLNAMKTRPIDVDLDKRLRARKKVIDNSIARKKKQLGQAKDPAEIRSLKGEQDELLQGAAKINTDIEANLGVDYNRMRQWRNEIGQATEKGSIEGGNQKRVYAQSSDSLRDIADRAGVRDRFDNLTAREAELYAKRGSLDEGGDISQLRTLQDFREGKRAFDYLQEGAKQKPERLELLMRNSDPDRWNQLSADMIEYMGRAKPGQQAAEGNFSPETFLTNWENMSNRTKELLTGNERKALDDLATAARAFRSRGKTGNASGTLSTGMTAGMFAALFVRPIATTKALAAGGVAGKYIASDAFSAYLAKETPDLWSRLGPRIAGQLGRDIGDLAEEKDQ